MSSPLPFLVNQTRWSDLLKQLAVAKGLDHVEVLGQLIGAIVLENDRPEHKYLAGERLGVGQFLLAAQGAGIIGYVGLRNPLGSGSLVVLEEARALHSSAGSTTISRTYGMLVRGATLTQASTEQPRDTRLQPSGAFGTFAPNIVGQVVSGRSDTIAVTPFAICESVSANSNSATLSASFQSVLNQPIVLAPGDSFLMSASDGLGGNFANYSIQGSFWWRERTLEPTET